MVDFPCPPLTDEFALAEDRFEAAAFDAKTLYFFAALTMNLLPEVEVIVYGNLAFDAIFRAQ
jgi:hypothetical protein